MFSGQVLIVILDAWCVKMFLSAYGNLMASSYGFTKFFAATMCLIGFCKITTKLDSYMGTLGVNLGRTGGGLGGLGALMMAGRLLRAGTGLGSPPSAKAGTGDGTMNFGTGKGIPLGSPATGAAAAAHGMTASQGAGIGGMASEPEAGTPSNPFGQAEMDDMPFMDGTILGADQNETAFPFGNPDELADGMTPNEEMNEPAMPDSENLASGQGVTDENLGMLPSMGMEGSAEELPFGNPSQTGMTDIEQQAGIDNPANVSPVRQENGIGDGLSDMETSYSGVEEVSPLSGTTDALSGAAFAEKVSGTGMDSASIDGSGGYFGLEAGGTVSPVGSDSVTFSGNNSGTGIEQTGSVSGFSGSLEHISAGNSSFSSGESAVDATGSRSRDSSMGSASYHQGNLAYGAGNTEEYGRTAMNSGIYSVSRDGESYMRYDAAQYERPKNGEYQTIHENGKTFYELPGNAPAPAMLPEVKATLEKDGTLHLEKTYQKNQGPQKEIRTVPNYPAGKKAERAEKAKQGQPRHKSRKGTAARNKKQRTDQS